MISWIDKKYRKYYKDSAKASGIRYKFYDYGSNTISTQALDLGITAYEGQQFFIFAKVYDDYAYACAMDSSKSPITLFDFETRETMEIPMKTGDGIINGHGGGDEGIVASWHEYLSGTYEGVSISDISTSVDNHLTVFAAEKSREEGIVVDVEVYKRTLEED